MAEEVKPDIRKLVSRLLKSYEEHVDLISLDAKDQINKSVIIKIIENLKHIIFAGFFEDKPIKKDSLEYYTGELLEQLVYSLKKQISKAIRLKSDNCQPTLDMAEDITYHFLECIVSIRSVLATDVDASFDGDPAATGKNEIILSYPGIYAIMVYRLAHELHALKVPLIPRIMTEIAHSVTGIDIHPGAEIGHHFFIDHGTGIVIGETTIIGNYVKVYQGVTLGAHSTRGGQALNGVKRHPTIEDNVTIYSGASIFGGDTVIGEGVVIGSNAFITKSVPANTRVSIRNPDLHFKERKGQAHITPEQNEFWDFMI
jgi:serine O-acetyltransferase